MKFDSRSVLFLLAKGIGPIAGMSIVVVVTGKYSAIMPASSKVEFACLLP